MVIVYALNINNIDWLSYQICYNSISIQRQNRANKYHNFKDSLRCIFSELIIKYIYPHNLLPINFGTNFYGKPYIIEAPFYHFNISHAGEWVVCATASYEIGVDVEIISDIDIKQLAEQFFTANEQQSLQHSLCLNKKNVFSKYGLLKKAMQSAEEWG